MQVVLDSVGQQPYALVKEFLQTGWQKQAHGREWISTNSMF